MFLNPAFVMAISRIPISARAKGPGTLGEEAGISSSCNTILIGKLISGDYTPLEKEENEKHKVDDAVTVDKKHSNDIQGPEEEDNKRHQSTTNSIF